MATRVKNKPRRSAGLAAVKPANEAANWMSREVSDLLKKIGNSISWWVGATYREHEKAIVGDASPQAALSKRLRQVIARWQRELDKEAERIAEEYVQRVDTHTIKGLERSANEAFFAIHLLNTRRVNTVFQSLVYENTRLIRNLADELMSKAEGIIWRGVSNGTDLQYIKRELQEQVGIEADRAGRIALDQSNKASQALAEVRAEAAGLIFGIWQHNSGGSKTYRDGKHGPEDHVALDGKIFVLSEGLVDIPGGIKKVKPGERPFCKCSFRVIIPGTALYLEALKKFPEYAEAA